MQERSGYNEVYYSKEIQAIDNTIGMFGKELLKSDITEGKELKDFIQKLRECKIEEIDVNDEFIKCDDIELWKNVMDIASSKTQNGKLKELAKLILPNIESMMKFTYEFLDCKQGKKTGYQNYSKRDREFIKRIKNVIDGKDELSEQMKQKDYFWDNVILEKENSEIFKDETIADKIEETKVPFKPYSKKTPLYIKAENGKIYELSKHPERTSNWSGEKEYMTCRYIIIPFLDETQKDKVKNYKKSNIHVKKPEYNMSQTQVQNNLEEYFEEI